MRSLKAFLDKWIPRVWAMLLVILITATVAGATIWSVKWLLSVLGVL